MDKSWINLSRVDPRYFQGVESFIHFVRENKNVPTHPCPCRRCKCSGKWVDLGEMRVHLITYGMMRGYMVWTMHGEDLDNEQLDDDFGTNDVHMIGGSNDLTLEMLSDVFPLREFSHPTTNDMAKDIVEHDYVQNKLAFEKYQNLLNEAQKPLHPGSKKTVLKTLLKAMELKVEGRWTDSIFDKYLDHYQDALPPDNNYPRSYREVKKIFKGLGMGYEIYHACLHGCILYYKEYAHRDSCPICGESRYVDREGKSRVPQKTVRYFPITPRLQRLYTSNYVAKEMRWHGERWVDDGDHGTLRHPADGDAWKNFDIQFPEFANEIRNVRLGLATDGFSPFGLGSTPHSIWPIMVMSYNLPPSLCMKKEFNILAMLVSGPKSPGKCLNNFMRPLIDELKMLWSRGVATYDRYSSSCFTMKAAVLWTISDFPGLGMVGGVQTKGYKACPVCLDKVDAIHLEKRMCYQGHRRWLPHDHPWRREPDKFRQQREFRERPPSLSGVQILDKIDSHTRDFQVLSIHPQFKGKGKSERICWTHKSIFYELPYWKYLEQPYSLDVMHIEKNVFEVVVGAVLSFEAKKHMWDIPSSSRRPSYVVSPRDKVQILEMIKDVKYPSGYAGSLKSKIKLEDKKFVGLKTHDCHVLLERLIPVFIRPYLLPAVVNPIVCLSRWFQRLCCRELTRSDVMRLKNDIVLILCQFEQIFPPTFFSIMVHLMIHLPDQILLKGPVHFNWMYPIERQLGNYKKYVRNTRYPEGCISEQYIAQECVTYVKLYLDHHASRGSPTEERYLVNPSGFLPNMKLDKKQLRSAHWCVLENCEKAKYYLDHHREAYANKHSHHDDDRRIKHCISYFKKWMTSLYDSDHHDDYLYSLSREPQAHNFYSHCEVNGVKFVTWERDSRPTTASQNSGVMVETDDEKYYGVVEDIIDLIYPHGVNVVVFRCRWFNENRRGIKRDRGLESVDTSQSWYEDTPYCLASLAKQVFYIDDPHCGENWRVVNEVSQRGIYSVHSLARDDGHLLSIVEDAYQEDAPLNIPQVPTHTLHVDLRALPQAPYYNHMANDEFDGVFEDDDEDDEDDGDVDAQYEDDGDDGLY